ncbi:hypothetical protein LZ32DRAFT_600704 [Colletotrichum eremochloae]|nr:hypothetical protein LZ32DRAFT_600704 [Colletotrichum eremochloae]
MPPRVSSPPGSSDETAPSCLLLAFATIQSVPTRCAGNIPDLFGDETRTPLLPVSRPFDDGYQGEGGRLPSSVQNIVPVFITGTPGPSADKASS